MMRVKVKKIDKKAIIPSYAKEGDACVDLHSTNCWLDDHGNFVYETGLKLEIPEGWAGLIFPRSSIGKTSLMLRNSVGVIDSGYRGQVLVKFAKQNSTNMPYRVGDRVAQLMIVPIKTICFVEVDDLRPSERGEGAFGSTGR